ncbi:VOC family protein [Amycolatopsis alkalitolerans]|uniref:VOC family protein n=1 Tax=Amycolatopsis alkalitolerans TaxID=2547244 RepID=A0A5C4LTG0_9PSEU|nr:VOC family protein [Amycolatopsis alkalitolerans]TNC21917.1 VOC family protein [Amycolatopsis alkalitolerans]
MPRPVHFEIHASDPERAITFYTAVFDWSFERWGTNPYWLISTGDGPGIDGGLVPRQGPAPTDNAPVNAYPSTMEVPDIDVAVRRVQQAGGTVIVPKTPMPGVGWLVYCTDTEGNIFGMLENDASAE